MINIDKQVPSIYYNASRDFQLLGHLYEVTLNYIKTNADMLYLLPNGIEADTRATELLATTIGFKLKRKYDKDQLAALVSIFPQLLKIKGTKTAIDLAGNALVKASGAPGIFNSEIDLENHILKVYIPIELSDITLFMDLLPYILPAGLRLSITRRTTIQQKIELPIGTSAVMRYARPGLSDNGHSLGLARISPTEIKDENTENTTSKNYDYDNLFVDYSSSNFIDPETGNANAGLFGATPIIKFDPNSKEESN